MTGTLSSALGSLTELDGLAGAGVDGAGVEAGQDGLADDVRDEQEDDLGLLDLFVLRGEEVLEEGNLAEAGGSADAADVLLLQDAGEDGRLAFLELDDLLGGVLGDDGLGHAGDGRRRRSGRRPRS